MRLYLVTDPVLCAGLGVVETVRRAVAGGVSMVQLRDKQATTEERVVLARELTKTFETLLDGSAAELLNIMDEDPDQARGEFVVMLAGAPPREEAADDAEGEALLRAMLAEGVAVKNAAAVVVRLLGGRRKHWYQMALGLKSDI